MTSAPWRITVQIRNKTTIIIFLFSNDPSLKCERRNIFFVIAGTCSMAALLSQNLPKLHNYNSFVAPEPLESLALEYLRAKASYELLSAAFPFVWIETNEKISISSNYHNWLQDYLPV